MTMTKRKEILFALITLVIITGVAEIGFRYFFGIRNQGNTLEVKTLGAYRDKPWVDQYFKDGIECQNQLLGGRGEVYERYVTHDLLYTCATQYVNYDGKTRTRKTWNPDPASLPGGIETRTIGFFGGSTMLGVGVPDDVTIPSHFSKLANGEANARGVNYLVKNYGVSSYTFTQSLMKLILLLREGERFDYVIFYGGANDIDNAYAAGEAGALYNEDVLRRKLEGGLATELKEFAKVQINSCGICRAILTVSRNTPVLRDYLTPYLVRLRRAVLFQEGQKKDDRGIAEFGKDIADYYVKSHELLDSLSRAYGFTYVEFWQPSLMYGGEPVGDEVRIFASDNRLTDEKLTTLYRSTRERVRSAKLKNFYDISDALDGRKDSYYLDAVHIGDDGNGDVAKSMFKSIGDNLPR